MPSDPDRVTREQAHAIGWNSFTPDGKDSPEALQQRYMILSVLLDIRDALEGSAPKKPSSGFCCKAFRQANNTGAIVESREKNHWRLNSDAAPVFMLFSHCPFCGQKPRGRG